MFNFVCYPNPFNKEMAIKFWLPHKDFVQIQVIDFNGQIVNTLVNDYINQGEHSLFWDGKNSIGQKLNNGIYYIKLIRLSFMK